MDTYYIYQFSWLPIAAAIAINDIAIASDVVSIAIANAAIGITSVDTDIAIESSDIVIISAAMAIATTSLAPHIGMSNSSKCCLPASVVPFYVGSVFTIIHI